MMKTSLSLLTVVFITLISITLKGTGPKERKLQHVVAFSYKPEITFEQQQKVRQAFYALQKEIPQIKAFEGGDDIKPGKKKFSQCFVVSVKNAHDLEVYGSHPKHKAFSAMVDPMLAEVMVIDYWVH
ncbi:MAG: Dabb family protein [Pedobacter sp.]